MTTDYQPPISDFPLLQVRDAIIYLDNAATTQKPQLVLQAVSDYYQQQNANVHRGVHELSVEATDSFEESRSKVKRFIGATNDSQIVLTRGTTESINLVAHAYGGMVLDYDSVVLVTEMEHHSNIVPWQLICERTRANLVPIRVQSDGTIDQEHYQSALDQYNVAIVAVSHVSNVLGTINPVQEMINSAHKAGAVVMVDGAQAIAHLDVDVSALDCDFYAFSSHKAYGPMGIGALYGKENLLNQMLPWQGGGEMIETVSFENTTYQSPPYKFEAGTPNVSGAIGMAAALDYLSTQRKKGLQHYEDQLTQFAISELQQVPDLRLIGDAPKRSGAISFLIEETHPHDVGTLLDQQNVAVRTGHHCAMPLMQSMGIPGTIRASLGLYNLRSDIESLVKALQFAADMLRS